MATPDDIVDLDAPGTNNFHELELFIQYNETLTCEFVFMETSQTNEGNNRIYYELHDSDSPHDPLVLQALPPGLTQAQADAFVDHLVDSGLQPFKSYFNVYVSGKEVSILPCRQGTTVAPDLSSWIFTNATVFGLNMDGSIDRADNGVGAPILGRIRTTDPALVGCALPIPVLKQKFGSLQSARGQFIEVALPDGSNATRAKIVDLGPSNAQIRKGIALDLTLGAQEAIHGDGLTAVKYRFV